ncbi:MAG: transposase [Bacteroidota bacterium]
MEILENGFYYHIYNRGNNKEILFPEREDYVYFLQLYIKYIYPIADLYCYCLIPNHFHFLLRIKEKSEILSYEIMQKQSYQHFSNYYNAYAKYINLKYGRTGSLFQERFKRKKIDNEIYLKHLIHYIHTNPVHHEVVDDFTIYPYSSYASHLKSNLTILEREKVIEYFEDRGNYIYTHRQKARIILIKNLIKGD